MKKILLTVASLYFMVFAAMLSCTKSYNDTNSVTNVNSSLNQAFAGLRSSPQIITVTAGTDVVVNAAKGTQLHFYPNSFKDANGNTITSGTVTLQVVEMYKPGDMIANRASTMANGQILQSSGQININATMNGQQVYTNGYGIGFKHSTSSTTPMALFYGGTANTDSTVTWAQSDTTHQGSTAGGSTSGSGGSVSPFMYYFDTCASFTFINCDCFYGNDSPKTSVSVILPNSTFTASNTCVYLVLPNISRFYSPNDTFNAVIASSESHVGYTAATNTMQLTFGASGANIVPAGLNYELVVIANVNGQYYYYQQTGTIPHNGVVATANIATTTQNDVLNKLSAL